MVFIGGRTLNMSLVGKKITIILRSCDNCPHIKISKGCYTEGQNDNLDLFICGYGDKDREIIDSDRLEIDEPVDIPGWCPLEDEY